MFSQFLSIIQTSTQTRVFFFFGINQDVKCLCWICIGCGESCERRIEFCFCDRKASGTSRRAQ
jgi:hypothetical protein